MTRQRLSTLSLSSRRSFGVPPFWQLYLRMHWPSSSWRIHMKYAHQIIRIIVILECFSRPTVRQFAPILPGQEIPPALHIRLNLQTGRKEAKIPDPSDRDEGGEVVIVNSEDPLRGKEKDDLESFVLSSVDASLETTSEALQKLEDIAHEVDWGTAFAQGEKEMTIVHNYLQHNTPNIRLQAAANNPMVVELAETIHNAGCRLRTALPSESDSKVLHRLVYAFASYSRASNLHGTTFQKDMKVLMEVYNRVPESTQSKILDLLDDLFNPDMIRQALEESPETTFKVQNIDDTATLRARNEWEPGWCSILSNAGAIEML
ncbi:hypothetical protein BJ742DRAFT_864771 [Cladochytrium replicatum]|nr:hypothetical protein BJ742DRAFT_864771 [Cladochytrium replicatum]